MSVRNGLLIFVRPETGADLAHVCKQLKEQSHLFCLCVYGKQTSLLRAGLLLMQFPKHSCLKASFSLVVTLVLVFVTL